MDDTSLHAERLQMWRDFNLCWLGVGQTQKEMSGEATRLGHTNPNLLTQDMIQQMVDELVRLNDGIEQYGLVDFDMGVWEEEIIHIFEQCLDIVKTPS